jgi:hypothetical protein
MTDTPILNRTNAFIELRTASCCLTSNNLASTALAGALMLASCNPALAQAPAPSDAAQAVALALYTTYAIAQACMSYQFYFTSDEISAIAPLVEKRLGELQLSEADKNKLWTGVQAGLQVIEITPALCLDTRQWFALTHPEVFSKDYRGRPF